MLNITTPTDEFEDERHARAPLLDVTRRAWLPTQPHALQGVANGSELSVRWVREQDELRAAQRLRYAVFAQEMGAQLDPLSERTQHDIDEYDDWCEHLIVEAAGEVVGTYRLLTPFAARSVGRLYTEGEFDLSGVAFDRATTVELGRSCVHADYRSGAVILALWGALADFMARNQLTTMIGCASIPMHAGAHAAASAWRRIARQHESKFGVVANNQAWPAKPWCGLPVDALQGGWQVEPPALIKGYQRLGARVLGLPAWDAQFNTADVPMLMHTSDLPARYRRLMARAQPGACGV